MREIRLVQRNYLHIVAHGRALCGVVTDQPHEHPSKVIARPDGCPKCKYEWGLLSTKMDPKDFNRKRLLRKQLDRL